MASCWETVDWSSPSAAWSSWTLRSRTRRTSRSRIRMGWARALKKSALKRWRSDAGSDPGSNGTLIYKYSHIVNKTEAGASHRIAGAAGPRRPPGGAGAARRVVWSGREARGGTMMKITDVTLTLSAGSDIPATTYGRHTGTFAGKSQVGLVTINTDEGVPGHAFLGSAMRGAHFDAESLIHYLKPLVMGQDPLERERLWQAMWQKNRQTTLRAIGAMDIALWDIAGKVAGLPIHRLLGSYRDRVPAYASSAVLASKEAYAAEAARFTALAPWITAGATDYLRGDPAVKGGITPLIKTAHLAEAFHMNFEVHHGGNSLNNVANLHVIMAIKNCEFFEVLLPAGAQKYGPADDIEGDARGVVHAPTGPGLRAAIDFALIARHQTALLS